MLQKLKLKGVEEPPVEPEKKQLPWRRVGIGAVIVSLGVAAAAVGIASMGYRLTHLVVDDGLINGRIVRLRAPASGNLKAFYARPGVLVKSGQVLARIDSEPSPQEEQVRLQLQRSQEEQIRIQLEQSQLQGDLQTKTSELAAARQSLVALKTQLQGINTQYTAVQGVDVKLASQALQRRQAAVEEAIAKATAARLDYERYQRLAQEGAASKQRAEQLQFDWEAAEATVEQAKANLRSGQTSLSASQDGVALSLQDNLGSTLSDQRANLQQEIQTQEVLVSTLEAQVVSGRQQLNQSQSLYKSRPPLVDSSSSTERYAQAQEVSAVLTGVVYSTEREQGEQVSQSEPVLTLLDCNDLWVETVVRADQASQIDTQKPVSVRLASYAKPIVGEVDLIQPINSIQGIAERSKLTQVQALLPAISPTLVGQALARVTVRIPPPPEHIQSQRFCGLGNSARLTFGKKPSGSN